MRQINKITKVDCEGMPDPDAIYSRLFGKKIFSKFDCCKGYWQIPMEESSKEITAFTTPFGHYHFNKMPFGLVNSGATYAKMMRQVLDGLCFVDNFVDDVLEHTFDWPEHIQEMERLFKRFRSANLTVKPSKCFIGFGSIEFVGHKIKDGKLMTLENNIEKVEKAIAPKTKKQLRSLLGLTGYYRKFIPNYAEKVKVLTDLTKDRSPDKLPWSEIHQHALDILKQELCSDPVLKIPNLSKKFVVRTDASDTGLGAVLLQEHDGILFPVMYCSRKLLPREQNYAIMERECLAVVWAINKLKLYLYGVEFVIQTDHESLSYMNKAKFSNQRVMRWALSLQPYRYVVQYIKGCENVGADFLSRHAQCEN